MDVVGFSGRDNPHQTMIVRALNVFVKEAKKRFRSKASQNKLLFIPTGDGMAIAFLDHRNADEVEQPVQWAWDITNRLEKWNARNPDCSFELRMGLHSGKVERIIDAYKRPNIAGPGINLAQRIMDCGDAKHILSSKEYGDDLLGYSATKFQGLLQKRGREYRLKGGESVTIYNLYGELEKRRAGLYYFPEPKPRVEELPKDLRQSVLLLGDLMRQPDQGKSVLALCLSEAYQRRLDYVRGMHLVRDEAEKWNDVFNMLTDYVAPVHKNMELMSIILPNKWADHHWRRYQARLLEVTSTPNTTARRLHVISKDGPRDLGARDGTDAQEELNEKHLDAQLRELVPLLLAEFICSVRGRALFISEKQVAQMSGEYPAGHKWRDFALLDYGLYRREGGRYSVIFTDIRPYFTDLMPSSEPERAKSQVDEFALYTHAGNDAKRYIHEELRANFFRGWHNRELEAVMTLPKILSKAEERGIETKDFEKIKSYLPLSETGLKSDWKEALTRTLEDVQAKPASDPYKIEDKLIELLPDLRDGKRS